MSSSSHRGISPIVGTILLIAITIILASTLAFAVGAFAPASPAPTFQYDSTGTVLANAPGVDDQWIEIDHDGGDPLPVSEVSFIIELPGENSQTRLIGLPVTSSEGLSEDNVVGDDIIDRRQSGVSGAIVGNEDREWTVGESVGMRIKQGGDGTSLEPGDFVQLSVVHEPSNTKLAEKTFEAVEHD